MGRFTENMNIGITLEPMTGDRFISISKGRGTPALHEHWRADQWSRLQQAAESQADPADAADAIRLELDAEDAAIWDSWTAEEQAAVVELFGLDAFAGFAGFTAS